GRPGQVNSVTVGRGSAPQEEVDSKAFTCRLETGDFFAVRSGGGGGHGDPLERDPYRVARDVADGYVSREAARTEYGVVVGSDNQLAVSETQGLRALRRTGTRDTASEYAK